MHIAHRLRLSLAALVALVAVAAAAGGALASTHGTTRGPAVVKLRSTALGKVLVDAGGFTLYMFEADKGARSACYGKCASFWPPLLASGKPKAGSGVKASLLRTTKRKDGKLQVTYRGHPLYRFALDRKPGQTSGEDVNEFGGRWYAVSAAGAKVEPKGERSQPPSTGKTTTTPGGGYDYGGGYGY